MGWFSCMVYFPTVEAFQGILSGDSFWGFFRGFFQSDCLRAMRAGDKRQRTVFAGRDPRLHVIFPAEDDFVGGGAEAGVVAERHVDVGR